MLHFELPPRLIAQEPCSRRDGSRLLVVRRADQSLSHHHFRDLADLLRSGDLLILNDSRVLPARLLGRRQTGGKWEGLFLRALPDGCWEMLCRGRLRSGETISVEALQDGDDSLKLRLIAALGPGRWQVRPDRDTDFAGILERHGHVPLPPYIRKGQDRPEDRERYQTVFARHAGAIAAPTAGLHFTAELLDRLAAKGIEHAQVTLHVGLGTFQPIQCEDYTKHVMHKEWCRLPEETVSAIARCRARQGRIVAVGTTSVRVLETVAATGPIRPWAGETDLFIYPPYRFAAVDVLLTNFHLPGSTLLLLAAAFAGDELLERAYQTAIAGDYRFFSYGDAMLIV